MAQGGLINVIVAPFFGTTGDAREHPWTITTYKAKLKEYSGRYYDFRVTPALRFNERKDNAAGRFVKAMRGIIGKGLKYAELIAADGGDGLSSGRTSQTPQRPFVILGSGVRSISPSRVPCS